VAGGSWLGISRQGRLAALANVFDPSGSKPRRSRGELVREFLAGAADQALNANAMDEFAPFRFFSFDAKSGHASAQMISNREGGARLAKGLHVFSNNPPLMPWKKTAYVRSVLDRLSALDEPLPELFALLSERGADTASSVFVVGPEFGTRCSTVITIDAQGEACLVERSFDPAGNETGRVSFSFNL
jgi:uncharacterized protein with NRDE domain